MIHVPEVGKKQKLPFETRTYKEGSNFSTYITNGLRLKETIYNTIL